jgi:hypothetical protein
VILARGRTRFAPPNDPGPGSVLARRRAPSFVGFLRGRHGGYPASDTRNDLDKPLAADLGQDQPVVRRRMRGEPCRNAPGHPNLRPRTDRRRSKASSSRDRRSRGRPPSDAPCRPFQARLVPHLPPLLRHPPARVGYGHSDDPRAARSQRRRHDHDLHPRPQSRPSRRAESRGRPVSDPMSALIHTPTSGASTLRPPACAGTCVGPDPDRRDAVPIRPVRLIKPRQSAPDAEGTGNNLVQQSGASTAFSIRPTPSSASAVFDSSPQ